MQRVGLAAFFALLVPFACLAAARVVDAESQQPLEGVHVVSQSILNTGFLIHGQHVERLHVAETVTNARGEYELPAWGPKARPIFSELDYGDPELAYFKPGYRPEFRGNPASVPNDSSLRTSQWDGQTIRLTAFRGTPEEWAQALRRLQNNLAWGDDIGDALRRLNDYWKAMPRAVWAIEQQLRALPERTRHVPLSLDTRGLTEAELRALVPQKGSDQ